MAISRTYRLSEAGGSNDSTIIAPAFSSVGSKGIVVFIKCEHSGTAPTINNPTDTATNTWTALPQVNHSSANISSRMFYAIGPGGAGITTNASHVVTGNYSLSVPWRAMSIWTIAADDSLVLIDSSEGQGNGLTKDAGSMTTTAAYVAFMGASEYTGANHTNGTGWTTDYDGDAYAESRYGASGATFSSDCTADASAEWTAHAAAFQEPAATSQFAAPTSDISVGEWLRSSDNSGTALYTMLDETAYDDNDYAYVNSDSTLEVKFAPVSDPATSSGHKVRYRIKGNGAATITVSLRQGSGTEIASWAHTAASTTTTSYEQTLSSGQADSITDYADLRLRFVTFTP
jgi:hypothetical protein